MKRLLLAFLLLPAVAQAQGSTCERVGLYAFALLGCPQEAIRPRPDLNIPLCEQPGFEQYAYLDYRCYVQIPFDLATMCYEPGCAVPYDHVSVSVDGEHYRVERGPASEIDANYRACRKHLGEVLGK